MVDRTKQIHSTFPLPAEFMKLSSMATESGSVKAPTERQWDRGTSGDSTRRPAPHRNDEATLLGAAKACARPLSRQGFVGLPPLTPAVAPIRSSCALAVLGSE